MTFTAAPRVLNPRPRTSLRRRLGKLAYFTCRYRSLPLAHTLSTLDAPMWFNYSQLKAEDLIAAWNATGTWNDLEIANGKVKSTSLGFIFQMNSLFASAYPVLKELSRMGWIIFENSGAFEIRNGDHLAIRAETVDDVDFIREMFIEKIYGLQLGKEWVVIDVGGNAGIAALYFASQKWVQKVVSYEPFAPTATAFAANMALNPEVASKISLNISGVTDENIVKQVGYDAHARGQASVLDGRPGTSGDTRLSVTLRNATEVVRDVLRESRGLHCLLKLDCEGSEYPILRDLQRSGAIREIDAMVIEWHMSGPEEIRRILADGGFNSHDRRVSTYDTSVGLIYAWRVA